MNTPHDDQPNQSLPPVPEGEIPLAIVAINSSDMSLTVYHREGLPPEIWRLIAVGVTIHARQEGDLDKEQILHLIDELWDETLSATGKQSCDSPFLILPKNKGTS